MVQSLTKTPLLRRSSGTIAGAGLDVFDVEPLPADHPIRMLDNVVLTGHTGYVVDNLYPLVYGQAVENISLASGHPHSTTERRIGQEILVTQQSELPKAILFDVFGTVVDWRGSIVEEGEQVWRQRGLDVDWPAFADARRGLYQPSMERIRSGEIGFVPLDVLHRSNLDQVLEQFGVADSDAERVELNRIWHRLKPWPDVVEGLTRLKSKFIIGTLSNGNIAPW